LKSVIIVRHAKSSWDSPGLPDFDRPLNDRGKEDGPKMAKRLVEKKITINTFFSSPAKRAKKTAQLFAAEFGIDKDQIKFVPELYHAASEAFFEVIASAPSDSNNIILFSHNPGITDFANLLTEVKIDDMPTCSVFAVKTTAMHWTDFKDAPKEFWFFDYPKSTAK
jgi:phosphohistidine phosphatase